MPHVVPGIPADYGDRIVARRVRIVKKYPDFAGQALRLLDAGCGNGATMLSLASSFGSCLGIDVSFDYLKQFEKEAARQGIRNCAATVADLCNCSLPDESFDRFVSFEVIEHLPDELQGVRTLYRLLKPNGMFAVSVPNKWWVFETHGAHLPLLPWNRVPLFSWLPAPIHGRFAKARIYTRQRIVTLLTDAGFHVRDVFYVTAPMDRLTVPPLRTLATHTLFRGDVTRCPILATSIMVLGDKPHSTSFCE